MEPYSEKSIINVLDEGSCIVENFISVLKETEIAQHVRTNALQKIKFLLLFKFIESVSQFQTT